MSTIPIKSLSDGTPAEPAAPNPPEWLITNRNRDQQVVQPAVKPPPLKKMSINLKLIDGQNTEKGSDGEAARHWLVQWATSEEMIGVWVSLTVHTVLLMVLAFLVISTASTRESLNLFGILSDSEELNSDLVLDSTLLTDSGDSVQIAMEQLPQALDGLESSSELPEMVRIGSNGNGKGEGGGTGEGVSMGAPSLKVPGYAQSKGSFSAWTDPRDPRPNENYSIVIQIRLPSGIKKFRGADLTGMVKGTDRYRQEIRFKSSEVFEIENGIVEIRIPVPGGAQRVRDTIQIESKLLREKQTFEIEF